MMSITRRDFLRQISAIGATGMLNGNALPAATARPRKKNVLLVIDEDIQNEILGIYNGGITHTPNIDRFAGRSIRFDNAYCSMPECGPSRAAIFTGMRPQASGIYDNPASLDRDRPDLTLIPDVFRRAGYLTVATGKLMHPPENTSKKHWDITLRARAKMGLNLKEAVQFGKAKYMLSWSPDCEDGDLADGARADAVVKFLETYDNEKPFFLGLGFAKPHDPYFAPKKYFDMYPVDELKLPARNEPKDATAPFHKTRYNMSEKNQKIYLRSRYAGMSYVDAQFGKVVGAMKRKGYLDNTIIIFMGDHGYHHGEHGHWGKWTVFEKALKSPFMIYDPDLHKDKAGVAKGAVEFIDLFPTLCELCDLPKPKTMMGKSLVPLLKDPDRKWDYPAFGAWRKGEARAVRLHQWKYMEFKKGKLGQGLFNLEKDPGEFYNLVDKPEHAQLVTKMQKLISDVYYQSPIPPLSTRKKSK